MRYIISLLFVFLAGCACDKPVIKVETQTVEVPIAVPCKATVPEKPKYNFDQVTPEADIYDKSKALLADRKLHLGYEAELTAALTSCIK